MNKGIAYFKDGHTEEIIDYACLTGKTVQTISFTTSSQTRYDLVKTYVYDEKPLSDGECLSNHLYNTYSFYKWLNVWSAYNGVLGDCISTDEIEKIELF